MATETASLARTVPYRNRARGALQHLPSRLLFMYRYRPFRSPRRGLTPKSTRMGAMHSCVAGDVQRKGGRGGASPATFYRLQQSPASCPAAAKGGVGAHALLATGDYNLTAPTAPGQSVPSRVRRGGTGCSTNCCACTRGQVPSSERSKPFRLGPIEPRIVCRDGASFALYPG